MRNSTSLQRVVVFDFNGDGVPDLLWAARDTVNPINTWINVHYGRPIFKTEPDICLKSPSFATVNYDMVYADVNGDGYNDLIVGSTGFQDVYHYVLVYAGGPQLDDKFDAAVGTDNASHFSQSIASIGDINGDGCGDILVGAPLYGRYGLNEQKGYWGIFLGDKHIATAINEPINAIPKTFTLEQSYPNPFNPTTTIEFALNKPSHVILTIYDSVGKEVTKLLDQAFPSGKHKTTWDGTDSGGKKIASGSYFYRIIINGKETQSKKLIFLK